MPPKRKRAAVRNEEAPEPKRQLRSSGPIPSSSLQSPPKKSRVASRRVLPKKRASPSKQYVEAAGRDISETEVEVDSHTAAPNNPYPCPIDEINEVRILSTDEVESQPASPKRRGRLRSGVENGVPQDKVEQDTSRPAAKPKRSTAVLANKTRLAPMVEICTPKRSGKQTSATEPRHTPEQEQGSSSSEDESMQRVAVQSQGIPLILKSSIPNTTECSDEENDNNDLVSRPEAESSFLDTVPSTDLLGSLPDRLLPCFNSFKRCLLKSLRYPDVTSLSDSEDPVNGVAMKQLGDLINGTVHRAEGNSCLVLGPRGSGKSKMVETCIQGITYHSPIILRLSGFVQTTDRHALREIAFQLLQQTGSSLFLHSEKAEEVVGPVAQDDEFDNPFLDTVDKFPEEMPSLPPSSQLHSLIPALSTLGRPVIVILDAFDLFALHPRQSLLYSLLDTVQNCRSSSESRGITVIGITSRINAIELLEKRVKSRFSGRTIRTSPSDTLQSYMKIARKFLQPSLDHRNGPDSIEWENLWKTSVDKFLEDKNVVSALSETFGILKDLKVLVRILTSCVLRLTPNQPYLSYKTLSSSVEFQRSRLRTIHLNNMPYPALCLLIASAHADTAGHKVFTFEMIYDSFQAQVRALASAPVQVNGGNIGMIRCTRDVLMSAFENLIACNIFVSAAAASSGTAKQFMKYRCDIDRLQIRALVDKAGITNLKKWLGKNQ